MAQKRDKTPNNNVTCGFNSVAHKDWSFRMWRRVQGELVANISARFAAPALKRSTIHFLGFPEDEGGTLLHVVIFLNTATFKSVSKSYSMGYVAWRGKAEKSWVRVVNLPLTHHDAKVKNVCGATLALLHRFSWHNALTQEWHNFYTPIDFNL